MMDYDALIEELSKLSPVEWPADEAGERITAKVAAAYAECKPQPRRPIGRIVTVAAAAAAAAALAIAGWQVFGGPGGTRRPSATHSSPGPVVVYPPTALTAMVVISRSGALAAVGVVPNGDSSLTCVTRSICYIEAFRDHQRRVDIARTLDGGATWHGGATLPPFDSSLWEADISCPKPKVCFVPVGPLGLLTTTNAFASVAVKPVAMPPGVTGQLQLVSCPTTRRCVAAVSEPGDRQALIFTTNGGKSWTAAKIPAIPKSDGISAVRCDKNGGACIAALIGGTGEGPRVAALGSTDGGASWTMTADHALPVSLQAWTSCGDGRNCLIVGSGGTLTFLHMTAGGQVSVRTQSFKKSWSKNGVDVSCPTGPVCYVETAGQTQGPGGLLNAATLELTRDGGRTWTSLGTPMAPALPHDVSDSLSCPVPAGCVAVANDQRRAQATWVVLSNLHHGH
jgi:hypothetical protein